MQEDVHPISCQTALHKLKRKIPYGWDLNIYRGCKHGCTYCYAMASHQYFGENDFSTVYAKTNIAEVLDKELSSPKWKRDIINLGGVTDSYQPAEKNQKLMPDILKVLIKHKNPIIISTKSDLVLRDYDLIDELSQHTYVNIAATITSTDQTTSTLIEPYASTSKERFSMLKQFRNTNASVGLHVMPIIPFITDNKENIEAICYNANIANVHYMLPGTLYLRGATREIFFNFVKKHFPEKAEQIITLYPKGGAGKTYKDNLYKNIVNPLRAKYNISSSYMKPMKEKMK